MRIAVVSDIPTAIELRFEAVLADLRQTVPDLILHGGGDLADGGASPAEIVDHIRDLGWPGVLSNTDEMHVRPESLEEIVSQSPAPRPFGPPFARWRQRPAHFGEERISWMRRLPRVQVQHPIALVHASPASPWRSAAIALLGYWWCRHCWTRRHVDFHESDRQENRRSW